MFDLAFVVILSVFSLLAFIKGFIKSLFSAVNWILAALISYFLTPLVAAVFSEQYSYLVLHSVVSSVLFMASIVIFSLTTSGMTKTFLTVMPRSVDQSLGFAFGFTKGYLIFSLLFSIIITIYSSNIGGNILSDKSATKDGKIGPSWLVESQSYKILDLGGKLWDPLIEKVITMITNPSPIKDKAKKELEDKIKAVDPDKRLDDIKKIKGTYDVIDDNLQKGYHKKEIEKMNQLIETIE